MSRSVTVSGVKTPPTEHAFTVTSGPSIHSSTRQKPFRDAAIASSIAAGSSSAERTNASPR